MAHHSWGDLLSAECSLSWSICLYLLALLQRSLLYMVVLALICWPIWVVGVDRNWVLSIEIPF